jgi:hypothetical protein
MHGSDAGILYVPIFLLISLLLIASAANMYLAEGMCSADGTGAFSDTQIVFCAGNWYRKEVASGFYTTSSLPTLSPMYPTECPSWSRNDVVGSMDLSLPLSIRPSTLGTFTVPRESPVFCDFPRKSDVSVIRSLGNSSCTSSSCIVSPPCRLRL